MKSVAAFGGHLFMTYFYRAGGMAPRHGPSAWPLGPLDLLLFVLYSCCLVLSNFGLIHV